MPHSDFESGSALLHHAADIISGEKRAEHGDVYTTYAPVARMWSAYLNIPVTVTDVIQLMVLLKVGRGKANPDVVDNVLDQAGYTGLLHDARKRLFNEL